ncbi:hypothetical protein KIPB_016749, partial [Kipferlia bialata]|eukprot:g16749.t1
MSDDQLRQPEMRVVLLRVCKHLSGVASGVNKRVDYMLFLKLVLDKSSFLTRLGTLYGADGDIGNALIEFMMELVENRQQRLLIDKHQSIGYVAFKAICQTVTA